MMARPDISVILPTRRRHHLLPRALKSLFLQTFTNFEIILVDDNPVDSRVRQQASLHGLLEDSRIHLVENPKPKNAAAARNRGLVVALGEWVTYLDDDDAYRPLKLQKQWQKAQETKLPVGLCGLAYNLMLRKRIRQTTCHSFFGPDLLLSVIPDTKAIFHRNTNRILFNENLNAAEDAYFFYNLIQHYQVDRVFNVPEPLVEVYPQAGPRVNHNALGAWQAAKAIYQEFAPVYGTHAAESFLLRARLGYLKLQEGCWSEMVRVAFALLRRRGLQEARFIMNAFCLKMPGAKRWLVS